MKIKKRKIWIFPLPIAIAILFILLSGGALIYALTKTTEKAGPVGYWKFDEGDGTVAYDASGNNNNGTLTNFDFNSSSSWTAGKVAGALKFDGTNDYIDAGTSTSLQLTQWTFEMWIYRQVDSGTYERLLGKSDASALDYWLLIHDDDSLNVGFKDTGDVTHELYGSSTVSTGTWVHAVGTFDGTYLKTYVNGDLKKTSGNLSAFTPRASNKNLWIGRNQSSYGFNGSFDEVRIYNRALSAAEVSWDYNRGGPVGWWKFDEGTASTTYDSSGNGNNGTWSGTGTHWTSGKINSAGQFNGTDDNVTVTDSGILNITQAITLEAWVYYTGFAQYPRVVRRGGEEYALWKEGTQWRFQIEQPASANAQGTSGITNSTWYHLVGTFDGTDIKIYINGKLEGTTNSPGTISATPGGIINIGQSPFFQGLIDDVRIYNYARTAAEIRTDYNAGFAVRFGGSYDLTQGLVSYWDLDEGAGTTAYDSTLNGNNGTLTNFDFNDTSNWTSGKVAGALKLDGSNDYVNCGSSTSLQITDAITMATWVNPNQGYGEVYPKFVTNGNIFVSNMTSANGSVTIGMSSQASGYVTATWNGPLATNTWTYVVGTYDKSLPAGNLKIYINGDLKASTTETSGGNPASLGGVTYIGDSGGQERVFNGSIDDVRIYNRALSADEVRYLYNRKGPVGWWKFDEGAGSSTIAYDSSGNGNNGTIYGASSTAGKINSALSFDGTDDYVEIPHSANLNITSAITVSAWVKMNSLSGSQQIVAKSGNTIRFLIVDGRLFIGMNIGGVWQYGKSNNTTLVTDTWSHVVFFYDGSQFGFFLNGKPDGSYGASGALDNNLLPLLVGKYTAAIPQLMNGFIDDVRIYNYARTAAEIRTDYNSGFAVKFGGSYDLTQGLVGYWKFSEGGGYTVNDSSGSGNNGVLNNFAFDSSSGWTNGNAAANTGGALKFDGVDDYVDAGDNTSLRITGEVTVAAWIRIDSWPSTGMMAAPIKKSPSANYGYRFLSYSDQWIRFDIGNGSTYSDSSNYYPALGAWHYYVGIFRPSVEIAMYVDGVKYFNTTSFTQIGSTVGESLKMGAIWQNYFNGRIDEVRIYNRALSADEIRYLYNRKQPIAHWKFDEGAGQSAFDSSINENTGQLGSTTGADAGDPTWTEGYINRALSFDGQDDYVDAGNGASLRPTIVTVEAWIKKSSGDGTSRTIVDYASPHTTGYGYDLYLGSDNRIWFKVRNIATGMIKFVYSTNTYTDSNWHHVVGTYDGVAVLIYVDGISVGTYSNNTGSGDIGYGSYTTKHLMMGRQSYDLFYPFNGLIDDVRIYNYARTAAEIKADYNAGMSTYFK